MGKFNPDKPRTTFDLSPATKHKLAQMAESQNLSVQQVIERLVSAAEIDSDTSTIREEFRRLDEQVGEMREQLDHLKQKVSYKATRKRK